MRHPWMPVVGGGAAPTFVVLALVALLLVPQIVDRSGWYAAAGQLVYRESVLADLHDGPRPIRNIYSYSRTGRRCATCSSTTTTASRWRSAATRSSTRCAAC